MRERFGAFEADFERRELWRGGERVVVQEKPLQLLEALVRRRGEVVSREDLHRALWPEARYLDFENNLNVAARKLREALGESAAAPVWVHTVPRRGYCFDAPEAPAKVAPSLASKGAEAHREGGAIAASSRKSRWRAPRVLAASLAAVVVLTGGVWLGARQAGEDWAGPTAGSAENGSVAAATRGQGLRLPTPDGPQAVRLRLAPVVAASPELEANAREVARQLAVRLPVLRPGRLVVIDAANDANPVERDPSLAPVEAASADRSLEVELRVTVAREGDRRTLLAEAVDLESGAVIWSFSRPPEPHESLTRGVLRRLPFELLPPADAILAIARDAAFETTATATFSPRREALEAREAAGTLSASESVELASLLLVALPLDDETLRRASALADRGVAASPRSAQALATLGWAELRLERRWGRAEELFRSALDLDPREADAVRGLLVVLTALGRRGEAVALLDELSPAVGEEERLERGWAWLRLGRFERAGEACSSVLEGLRFGAPAPDVARAVPGLDAGSLSALYCLELAELRTGHGETALRRAEEALASRFRTPEDRRLEGIDAWTQLRLDRLGSTQHGTPFGPAHAWRLAYDAAELGEADLALAWLERGLTDGDETLLLIGADPAFDALRGDPRFIELVARTMAPRSPVSSSA